MISEHPSRFLPRVPFIARYAEKTPDLPAHIFRYDSGRQVSQVLIDGCWVDSPEAFLEPPGTRLTRVGGETTDDQ